MGKPALDFSTEPGYIFVTDDAGNRSKFSLAGMLRAADIPTGLTYSQITGITALANLIVILIRTLIDRNVLDEDFLEESDIDLNTIVEAIENMGGDYGNPDLTGSET